MTSKNTDNEDEPSTERNLVIRDVNRTESAGHLEVAIEQSDEEAEIEITTHPPGVEVKDSDGEVARIPLDDELTLNV
ncbi:hypothetical protein GRS48_12680 [Halorubrum sp. JWXQ-INN 858]|uniref:hypothetical protein n=1 Tax=Halorubrum sp. JWXQ-INN 858 TaxID=2690782 RepID=UPI00135C76A2|nr:hypothetical protein [Halorubrum sp. JWXQ-INN 858]MWV65668.1 hypothetical protein [Halorubrum sp. JWXQ-INN 858]